MNGQHTPGPWRVDGVSNRPPYFSGVDVRNADGVIARVQAPNAPDARPVLANACLIAAAPDLLEALEHVAGLLAGGFPPNDMATVHALDEARTVLAKARGVA